MSLLSDFFVATPAAMQAFAAEQSPVNSFPTLQAGAVEAVKLVTLQCIIDGSSFEEHADKLDALIVRSADEDEGPWVLTVPDVVVAALAQANEKQIAQYGSAWAATEEWELDGVEPDEIIDLLKQLAPLARLAAQEGKKMYLWVSL